MHWQAEVWGLYFFLPFGPARNTFKWTSGGPNFHLFRAHRSGDHIKWFIGPWSGLRESLKFHKFQHASSLRFMAMGSFPSFLSGGRGKKSINGAAVLYIVYYNNIVAFAAVHRRWNALFGSVWLCKLLRNQTSKLKVLIVAFSLFIFRFSFTLLCWTNATYTSFNRWPLFKVGQLIEYMCAWPLAALSGISFDNCGWKISLYSHPDGNEWI